MDTTKIIGYKKHNDVASLIKEAFDPSLKNKPALLPDSYDSLRRIAVRSKTPNAETMCKAVILRMLLSVNISAFGNRTDRYMSDEQAADISIMLYDEYGDFNVNEFSYVAKGIKMGKYGKLYGNFTSDFVCGAFEEYRKERAMLINKSNAIKYAERINLMETIGKKGFEKYNSEMKSKYEIYKKWLNGDNPDGLVFSNILKFEEEISFSLFKKILLKCKNKKCSLIKISTSIENSFDDYLNINTLIEIFNSFIENKLTEQKK